jgi:hypothetical protein
MLTEKELKLVETYAKAVSTTFGFPFDWKKNQLEPSKSKGYVAGVYANFLFSFVYLIFILARMTAKYGGTTLNSMPFHAFAAICHCVYFFFHIHGFIYNEDMAILFNQLVHFNQSNGKCHAYTDFNFRIAYVKFFWF